MDFRKKSLPFNDQENLLVSFYDIIMELRELSKLSKDYIAEMLTKLGLYRGIINQVFLRFMIPIEIRGDSVRLLFVAQFSSMPYG